MLVRAVVGFDAAGAIALSLVLRARRPARNAGGLALVRRRRPRTLVETRPRLRVRRCRPAWRQARAFYGCSLPAWGGLNRSPACTPSSRNTSKTSPQAEASDERIAPLHLAPPIDAGLRVAGPVNPFSDCSVSIGSNSSITIVGFGRRRG